VLDIVDSAERIMSLLQGVDIERFTSDPMLHDAVLYNLVIIGEAARYVPAEVQARHSDVPWRDMREMRNFVAHVYHGVSDRRVWKTIETDLPHLPPRLRQLLADELESGDGAGDG
jgi:uncharacterized protein with HEPN domain